MLRAIVSLVHIANLENVRNVKKIASHVLKPDVKPAIMDIISI